MTKDEALKMALEALEHEAKVGNDNAYFTERQAIREVLAKPWVNPSIKEYDDIMLANITPRTNDERDGIMGALNDMAVLLQEKNT